MGVHPTSFQNNSFVACYDTVLSMSVIVVATTVMTDICSMHALVSNTCFFFIAHAIADGFRMDGRQWKVNYADELDFKHFDWAWIESRPRRCEPFP